MQSTDGGKIILEGQGRKGRRVNLIDASMAMVLFLSLVGFTMAKAGHAGVNKIIQGTPKVAIQIYFVGLKTADVELFKVGEKASLTIRNQPVYPPMTITAVKHWSKKVAFLAPDGKRAVAFDDPAQPLAHDFLVTLTDDAEQTPDGFVIRGNKIKIGNQVELESFKYRVQGVVVEIRASEQP